MWVASVVCIHHHLVPPPYIYIHISMYIYIYKWFVTQVLLNDDCWENNMITLYMWTLLPEAGISGGDKLLHPTVFCGMQLLIPAWDPCFWQQGSHIWCIPYPEPVYTGWSSVHWNATGMPLVDPVYTGIALGYPANTCRVHWNTTGKTLLNQPHAGMPLEKLSWIRPTLGCHWRNSNFCGLHWNTTGGTVAAHTRPETYS